MKLTKKRAPVDRPQAVFTAGTWTWKVLKTYQNDDSQPYARWLVAVTSPMTYGMSESGDTYVREVVVNGRLTEVDGREPTDEDRIAVDRLRVKILSAGNGDPLREMFGS